MSFAGEMSPADFAAVTGNDKNNGMFNNDWAWIIILLLFGWGGRFGNFGGNANGNDVPCATQADVRAAVDQQTLISKLDQQTYGLADSTYSLNNTITNGFHGVDNAVCNLGYNMQSGFNSLANQLSSCCCETQQNIERNTNQSILNTNAIQQQISSCCCDIEKSNMQSRFDAQAYNCNTLQAIDKLGDRIIDYMANEKAQTLRDENQALKLAASQSAQNQYIINSLRPMPIPAYASCNPWNASSGCSGCSSF